MRRIFTPPFAFLLTLTAPLFAQAPPGDVLLPRAAELAKVEKDDALAHAEMLRAAGRTADARAALARSGHDDLLGWRLLPVPAERDTLRAAAERLGKGDRHGWATVYRLRLAALDGDRAALLAAAGSTDPLPDVFPTVAAEKAHRRLLTEFGLTSPRAGQEVLAHRDFAPLSALRDLDRHLTREAAFLHDAGRAADAQTLRACRDRLRAAYLNAARHVPERLLALELLDRTQDRDRLAEQVKAVPYLHNAAAIAALFDRLDEEQVDALVLRPLLDGEVRLVEGPPALGVVRPRALRDMTVTARQEDGGVYRGSVRARIGHLSIACDRLTVTRSTEPDEGVALTGSGNVRVGGVPGHVGDLSADRFSWSSDTGTFTLAGGVRLPRRDGTVKLRACTVGRDGSLRDARTLLDDFAAADEAGRLALLPRLSRDYADNELPPEVRYLLALHLLRPHMTWHAPYLPPLVTDRDRLRDRVKRLQEGDGRWLPALGGESWMLGDIPADVRKTFLLDLEQRRLKEEIKTELLKDPGPSAYFWRLRDPAHADVVRALKLLNGIRDGDLAVTAQRWSDEVRRNNTVVTIDVTGGYQARKDAPVVVDVRSADKLSFRLYRVKRPDDLLWITDRIGNDFVYLDHGLQSDGRRDHILEKKADVERRLDATGWKSDGRGESSRPDFLGGEPLAAWTSRVGDLQVLRSERNSDDEDRDEDEDEGYFGDACERYRERLYKRYRPDQGEVSSWQCDRVVRVPGKHLAEPGAYVLAVEANGQTAYAPLLVEPLTLTLRRSRDGVLVVVSDASGERPVADAEVLARAAGSGDPRPAPPRTDAEGVAWARVVAAGDRAVIVHKDGRFAIGGFGRVFDGIYRSPNDRDHRWGDRLAREVARVGEGKDALIYADRHVVAAYTDRPTYRPGQEVQFKVIVRRLALEAARLDGPRSFRDDEFDVARKLELLPDGTEVPFTLIDSKGEQVGVGVLKLNDFGTAAAKATLDAEAPLGLYDLRLRLGGQYRTVPGLFAVRSYRLPTFKVEVAGVPDKVTEPGALKLKVTGIYNFGKPVSEGRVSVRLMPRNGRRSVADTDGNLDVSGNANLELSLEENLAAGEYLLVVDLTDAAGRTASTVRTLTVERPGAVERPGLADVPRFHPVGKPLVVRTAAARLTAEQWRTDDKGDRGYIVAAVNGRATLLLTEPGWYRISDGTDATELFVYGGHDDPATTSPQPTNEEKIRVDVRAKSWHSSDLKAGQWVNLTDYAAEEHQRQPNRRDRTPPLLALFDKHHAEVGGKLSVLVFAPSRGSRLLLSIEGRTVVDYVVVTTPADGDRYCVVELPIKARYLPNFFLQGRVLFNPFVPPEEHHRAKEQDKLRARDWDEADNPLWCRVDVIDPKRQPAGEKLNVEVRSDRDVFKPGEEVKVRLRVTGRDGKPRQAEASVAVVDESVFAFGEDRVGTLAGVFDDPRPERLFLSKSWRSALPLSRRLALEQRERRGEAKMAQEAVKELAKASSDRLDPEHLEGEREAMPPRREAELPVGTLPEARLRRDFRETAAWLPQLRTGADGVAEASFRLPDTLTTYRLTAVALTQSTEIGSGTSRLRATLPLAVQVHVPRFAVETDRIEAVGLVHNSGTKERIVAFKWEVEGATVEGGGLSSMVRVPAGQSGRVVVRLVCGGVGPVRVKLHIADGADTDAETRTFVVQPHGKPQEVNLDGAFTKETKVTLPADFVPHEVRIVVVRGETARALEGLGGLVDYPYGCVEQTMSRFLPAVVVRRASRDAAVTLPPEVANRLPDVLERGLKRLYGFQHADGGWGWWEKDATDHRMTIYVIHGLSLCRLAGTPVDRDVLERGCAYLRSELMAGKVAPPLQGRAWLALGLAGAVDCEGLARIAKAALDGGFEPEDRCRLALACRAAGLPESAERLWRTCRDWEPQTPETLALRLTAELEFGEPLERCQTTATRLLHKRQGLGWDSTQTTATAIAALARLLPYVAAKDQPPQRVRVLVGGKVVFEENHPAKLQALVYRVTVPADKLTRQGGQEIRLEADGADTLSYTVAAVGVQRLDKHEANGTVLRVTRRFETLDGKPLTQPLGVGQVAQVRLTIEADEAQDYVLLEERRPSNCEFADERLTHSGRLPEPTNVEFRDDRLCLFLTHLPAGRHEIVYALRAETVGTGSMLPGCVYPMYQDKVRGETGVDRVEVRGR